MPRFKTTIMPLALLLPVLTIVLPAFQPFQGKDNTLTDKEKKEGWVLLFDGKSTNSWRPYKNKPADAWEIVNGELHCKDGDIKNRADMITAEKYGDFELALDWKVIKGANSGVIYRADETHNASYESGPEYQLIDDDGYEGKLRDGQKSGADYDMHPPTKLMAKPVGEYNHTVIKVKGNHVQHFLNGEKVVDYEIGTADWKLIKDKSKWKDLPEWGQLKQGHICLQDHGGGIWFKNIKVRKL